MLKSRICSALGIVIAVFAVRAAEGEIGIPLGDYQVHPTRILARYKDAPAVASPQSLTLLSSQGLEIAREFQLVPGLVALDEPSSQVARMAVVAPSPEEQRQKLVERIVALRGSGLFEYVEPNYFYEFLKEPSDAFYVNGRLWGLRNDGGGGGIPGADISATNAWDISTGSTNTIVAVLDSGIRYTHQDLASQMWINLGEWGVDTNGVDLATNGIDDDDNGYIDDVHGINAGDPDNVTGDPMDQNDHGTHVAGTIGAAANNGDEAFHVGVAWDVRLMACKVGGAAPVLEGAVICIEYAVANGASVMNASWGGGPYSSALYDAIDAARQAGALFVAAAGNSADDNDSVAQYPANYELDNIISVAAVDRADNLAGFSNYGATTVDLGAPGVDIWSSISISDQSYDLWDGTSMASPHVVGVAALIKGYNPSASLFEMRQRILQNVVPIPSLEGFTVTGGRLNAYKALRATGDGELEMFVNPPEEGVILSGANQVVEVVVTDLFGVTDATVKGTFLEGMTGDLVFTNDGNDPDLTAGDEVYTSAFDVPVGISEILVQLEATAPDKIGVTNIVRWYVAEPPTNDNFADALKVAAEGTVLYSNNKFATMEFPDEPAHAGVPTVDASLWWSWSPSFDNRVIIDTAGSEFDTVVAVYTNKPLANVREVVSADNPDGRRQAYVQFDAKRGVTYYFTVAGTTVGENGGIRIRVEPNGAPDTLGPLVSFTSPSQGSVVTTNRIVVEGLARDPWPASGVARVMVIVEGDPAAKRANGTTNWNANMLLNPGYNTITATAVDYARNESYAVSLVVEYMEPTTANDHFKNALLLEGTDGLVDASNETATKEYLEPLHGDNEGGRSVWYRFEAPADGVLTLLTTNNTYDTLLGVYTGSVVTNLTTIAGNDDAEAGSNASRVSVGVNGGIVYSVAVDGFGGSSGESELQYEFVAGEVYRLETSAGPNGRVGPPSGDYAADSTVTVTAYPNPGYVFERWQGTIESVANPIEIVMDQDYSVKALFRSPDVTDDFESGGFSPDLAYDLSPQGSDGAWFVQGAVAAKGSYAARSADIAHNQSSILALEQSMVAGVGSFYYRVSTEAEFDVFEFRLNGRIVESWSGQGDWDFYQFVVPAGTNKLEWVYRKDASVDIGEDAAYIDHLTLPVFDGVEEATATLQMLASTPQLVGTLTGEPGRRYVVESSTDLKRWTELTRVTARPDGSVSFTDDHAASASTRYYRARSY